MFAFALLYYHMYIRIVRSNQLLQSMRPQSANGVSHDAGTFFADDSAPAKLFRSNTGEPQGHNYDSRVDTRNHRDSGLMNEFMQEPNTLRHPPSRPTTQQSYMDADQLRDDRQRRPFKPTPSPSPANQQYASMPSAQPLTRADSSHQSSHTAYAPQPAAPKVVLIPTTFPPPPPSHHTHLITPSQRPYTTGSNEAIPSLTYLNTVLTAARNSITGSSHDPTSKARSSNSRPSTATQPTNTSSRSSGSNSSASNVRVPSAYITAPMASHTRGVSLSQREFQDNPQVQPTLHIHCTPYILIHTCT